MSEPQPEQPSTVGAAGRRRRAGRDGRRGGPGRRRGGRPFGHRPGRPAGQGHADRQHDQAAARGGPRAELDEASRARLREIHTRSIKELEEGLAPELVEELERISLPFADDSVPTEAELRIAQAQLVGWLEGLFHGIQTALFAQQMAARAQFEEMRRRALPPASPSPAPRGPHPGGPASNTGQYL